MSKMGKFKAGSQRRNLIGVKVPWMEITFVLPPRFCFVYVVKVDTLASTEVTINFKSDAVRDVSAAGVDSQFKSSYRYRISKLWSGSLGGHGDEYPFYYGSTEIIIRDTLLSLFLKEWQKEFVDYFTRERVKGVKWINGIDELINYQ